MINTSIFLLDHSLSQLHICVNLINTWETNCLPEYIEWVEREVGTKVCPLCFWLLWMFFCLLLVALFFYRNFVAKGPICASFKVVSTAKEFIISEAFLIACRRVSHQWLCMCYQAQNTNSGGDCVCIIWGSREAPGQWGEHFFAINRGELISSFCFFEPQAAWILLSDWPYYSNCMSASV